LTHKIKVGAVSYLNTKPLVYGFEQGMMKNEVELSFDYPSNVAKNLLNNKIDIGLVPVAALPLMNEYHIISDYCIGATGPVASVCLFSDVPLPEIKTVLLDYQSRTSAALLKILIKEHWKIQPAFTASEKGFEQQIGGHTAGLVIGDRAFAQRKKSKYIYDLAEAWQQMTGLPFVFAVWASNKLMSNEFIAAFNAATSKGLQLTDVIAASALCEDYSLKKYYSENISYVFDEQKKQALKKFHQFLGLL
jgi:chorismate dehydratase